MRFHLQTTHNFPPCYDTTLPLQVCFTAFWVQTAVHRWRCRRFIGRPFTVPCYCPSIVSLSHSSHSPGSIHLCHTTRQPIISAIIIHNRVIEGERSQWGNGELRHHRRHGYHESHSHCSVMMTSYNDVTVF